MPLRDHLHGRLGEELGWESFHSAWANTVVRNLNGRRLPARYRSAPNVHIGASVEVDVATFEREEFLAGETVASCNGGGVATAVWAPPRPAQSLAVDLPAQDIVEVRVHDIRRGSRLVAAVEFVSPANKDRPVSRRAFAVKCAAYLQQEVSVVIVDVVTERRDNLHVELMELLDRKDAAPWPAEQDLYAIAYRTTKEKDAWSMELWPEALALGRPLPTLPLWLADNLAVPLELEANYEDTRKALRIA